MEHNLQQKAKRYTHPPVLHLGSSIILRGRLTLFVNLIIIPVQCSNCAYTLLKCYTPLHCKPHVIDLHDVSSWLT
ncbi:hypothetical protein XELAEV_18025176mg [Xenopus laevis]|uniref:Uncharacterized protein n=1 Tax=Xenopus laevis TaxID=8355 RepID=A0A974D1M9_XENLA|nr:hypothetical protein XELAEV_18025176mg [Xenopus laevis]